MFPSTLNRNLHKPTSGSKLRKSVTWDDLPPAITKQQTTPSPSPAALTPTPAPPPPSPTSVQRQRRPTKPSEPEAHQQAEIEDDDTDIPTTTPFGSRKYIHPGWSLLRAEQIRKHILALEGQHAREKGDMGRRDSGFVDVTQEDVVSGEMQVEYPRLPDEAETSGGVGYTGKGKGKERATGEGEQSLMEGMRVEYPSLPGVENGF